MAAMECAKAELEALNLEGGAEQSPEQPRRFTGRRLAAATAAALALAVVGLAAYHLAGGRAGPVATSAVAAGAGSGQDAVKLFGEYGGCTCDCTFASTPNACIPEAEDGNCCWYQCCSRGGAGGFVVDPGFAVEPGVHPDYHVDAYHGNYYPQGQGGAVVVHHHHYVYSHSTGIAPYFWWYVLFVALLVAACVGIYYFCWYRK